MEFHHTKLQNGLEIIAEVNPSAYSASIGYFVKTGARNETTDIAGVSHFLEHMVFKGTETRTAADVNRQLDEMGADANAFTSEEQTTFYASVLPELLDDAVELFADILRPLIREDDFELEKQVIVEEIKMYEDQPPFGADDKSRELFFGDHPLGNNVLGSIESVSALKPESMRQYLEEQYCPNNILLVGSGRLDFDHFVSCAERSTRHWNSVSTKNGFNATEMKRVRGNRGAHQLVKETATQQHLILLFDGPSALDEDRYAAGIFANMLGDDVGSRLYWELVDSGLADYAGMSSCEFLDNGFLALGMAGEPEDIEEILDRTRRIFDDIMHNGPTQEELDRAKNKVLSRLVLANERPAGRLFSIGGEWLVREEYRTVAQDLEDIRRIKLTDIEAVIEKYPLDQPLLVTVGPLSDKKIRYAFF